MRKSQQKILDKCLRMSFSEKQIDILKREDLTIAQLESVYNTFSWRHKDMDKDVLADEVEYSISIYHPEFDIKTSSKGFLFSALLNAADISREKRKIISCITYQKRYEQSENNTGILLFRLLFNMIK